MGLWLSILVASCTFVLLVVGWDGRRLNPDVVIQGIWAFCIGMALASVLLITHIHPIHW